MDHHKVGENLREESILKALEKFSKLNELSKQDFYDLMSEIRIVKEYMLTPYAFKLCLIRSKNTKIYANYYLLLEKVFKYFNDYKIKYNKIMLSIKDEELHKLTKKNKKKSKKIEELNEFIKETLIN
jgi:hypothetical protein